MWKEAGKRVKKERRRLMAREDLVVVEDAVRWMHGLKEGEDSCDFVSVCESVKVRGSEQG